MHVLVTGATGFVGSHLVEALLHGGHLVRVLARKTSDLRWIRGLPITCCWGDVREPGSLDEALRGVEWLFHVAGVTKALGYSHYLEANALGTRHVMEACARQSQPPSRVILISSLAACGPCPTDQPKREADPCNPVSHYGRSKLEAERMAMAFADKVPLTVIRPPAVYGPRDRDILAFFRLLHKGWDLRVGKRERYLCLIHVRDLVRGIIMAARAQVPSGSVFFLSDGQVHPWGEVVRAMARVMGVRARTIRVPVPAAWAVALGSEAVCGLLGLPPLLNREKVREMIQECWTCDIRKAMEELGFKPQIPLEEGLRETYLWYREQGWI
jgi:dihydroflavonol-4-reductase